VHENTAAPVAQPRVVGNFGDRLRNVSARLVEIDRLYVVGPSVQAQVLEAGTACAVFSPGKQAGANPEALVLVANRKRVEKHAPPVLELKHRLNMAAAPGRQHGIIFLPEKFGWERVRYTHDRIRSGVDGHEAITVGERPTRACHGNGQKARGGDKWKQVAEQEFVQATSGNGYESSKFPEVGESRRTIRDLSGRDGLQCPSRDGFHPEVGEAYQSRPGHGCSRALVSEQG
jgi:hypothetical protein